MASDVRATRRSCPVSGITNRFLVGRLTMFLLRSLRGSSQIGWAPATWRPPEARGGVQCPAGPAGVRIDPAMRAQRKQVAGRSPALVAGCARKCSEGAHARPGRFLGGQGLAHVTYDQPGGHVRDPIANVALSRQRFTGGCKALICSRCFGAPDQSRGQNVDFVRPRSSRWPSALCYPHQTVEPHCSSLTPLVRIEPKGCDRDHMLLKKLVVGLRGGSAGPPHGEHRSARPYCRRCAPGLNWPGRSSGAVTLKKLERTTAKAFAKDVFINQERKLGARRRSDTVLVSTINDADQGSADVAFRTPPAPYEKSKSLGSGGSMVARLKLKGIDGRAPPGVEPAA
ncbi:hypothetical protein GOBAR_AA32099 [Gossypium barbadense]|uniref:rRNA intron-encoded homing endonuclease n=1 Tax=Gossypium barbadense TaxID=3634 RepID=A0A2P5WBZ5_GOSBA|nr:hypothetical protein GOBAR_AA32099 [Gossypium barbadense]